MVARTAGRCGRPWRRLRAQILAESDVCHWCGHPGANAVDHLVPISRGGDPQGRGNLAPIHGRERCPTCGRACNSVKGNRVAPRHLPVSRAW